MKKAKKDALYLKISNVLEQQINSDVLKIGDKLPSIRTIENIYQVSITTAKQAFLELEGKGLVEARPRSGYYVSRSLHRKSVVPSSSKLILSTATQPRKDLLTRTFDTLSDANITQLSLGIPDTSFLPFEKLNKSIIKTLRAKPDSGMRYDSVQGNTNLRNTISRWSYVWGGNLQADDLITTSGATGAIYSCLLATTQPGDTIAVESPTYFNLLQTAHTLGLKVIELPTHPITGIEIEALKKVIPKIKTCVLISNFSNPLGSCMPEENKREVVRLLAQHGIPLIEDDIYGDIFFDEKRPLPCKAFDEEGMVLWCSSVSKTLAPGYRIGWVAPGKYKDKILKLKFIETIAIPSLYQEVVADFMQNGRYEHHLRTLRGALHVNSLKYLNALEAYFPEGTKLSRPRGGFMLWAELDEKVNTVDLFDAALKRNISISPGRMFTLQEQFFNCMRITYGLKWTPEVDQKLKVLGQLIKTMI